MWSELVLAWTLTPQAPFELIPTRLHGHSSPKQALSCHCYEATGVHSASDEHRARPWLQKAHRLNLVAPQHNENIFILDRAGLFYCFKFYT